jgi:peptidoglycan biosynthesis protein MviN/MurJ (putative lipid II flippase)
MCAVVVFGLLSSDELVRVFYERGSFGTHAAATTHVLVLCALPSVAFGALAGPLVSLWYADNRVRRVVRIGLFGFVAGTGATVALVILLGYEGIPLGTGVGYLLTFALFAVRTSTVLLEWSWRQALTRYGPAMLATAAAVTSVGFVGRSLLVTTSATIGMSLVSLASQLTLLLLVAFGTLTLVARQQSRPSSLERQ